MIFYGVHKIFFAHYINIEYRLKILVLNSIRKHL